MYSLFVHYLCLDAMLHMLPLDSVRSSLEENRKRGDTYGPLLFHRTTGSSNTNFDQSQFLYFVHLCFHFKCKHISLHFEIINNYYTKCAEEIDVFIFGF